jgi:cAMP-dependent protein kinase regulator
MAREEEKRIVKKKEALRESARRHLIKNQLSRALNDMRALYELDPADMKIKIKIGDILIRMGKKDEAIREYMEAVNNYADGGFLVQAIAVCKIILKNDPSRRDVAEKLADLYSQKGISISPETPQKEEVEIQKKVAPKGPIREIPLFSEIPKDAFIELLERMEMRRFPEKAIIFKEGEPGDSIWVLTQGMVRIYRYDRKGNRIWLKDLGEGDFFGEFGYFSRSNRRATVEAITDVECLEITREVMEEIIRRWPSVGDTLFEFYKKRVMSTFLAFSPLFGILSPEQRDRFIERFTRCVYGKDDIVIREGEEGDTFYMVKSGRLEVFKEKDGKRRVVEELGPGDFFGEIALLTGGKRTASVRAMERAELVCLKMDAFKEILDKFPPIRERIEKEGELRMKGLISIIKASERDTGLV